MKSIYKTPIVLSYLTLKYWKPSSWLRTKYGCPLLLLLFDTALELLAIAIKQEKEVKAIKLGKEEVKPSISARHDSLYRKS